MFSLMRSIIKNLSEEYSYFHQRNHKHTLRTINARNIIVLTMLLIAPMSAFWLILLMLAWKWHWSVSGLFEASAIGYVFIQSIALMLSARLFRNGYSSSALIICIIPYALVVVLIVELIRLVLST